MKVIGLTGGTGSGKSTVSAYLKDKGCFVIDADRISRELTAPGGEALGPIRERFGSRVFFEDGTLDRKKLGEMVFTDEEKLRSLEEITTRTVIKRIGEILDGLEKEGFEGIAVLDAPLLFECGMQDCADENWLVVADHERRIRRLMKRDGLDRENILQRMANQMSDEEKSLLADRVIDNSGSLEELQTRIDGILEEFGLTYTHI